MPIQNDRQGVSQGWGFCKLPGKSDFVKCFIVLDRAQQRLICYKRTEGRAASQVQAPDPFIPSGPASWPILTEFKTDSISLVEESPKIKKRQYCFAVHSLAKITHFAAESWRDMEDWIHCIKQSSRINVSTAQLNPDRVSIIGSYEATVIGGKVIQTPILDQISESDLCEEEEEREPSNSSNESESSDHQSADSLNFLPSADNRVIVKSGYCVKQGARMKNWKRRFLRLTGKDIAYYKNEFAAKPLKSVSLNKVKDCKKSDGEIASVRSNLMDIITPSRTFYMQFDSVDEMYSWIEEIRKEANLPVKTYL